MRRCQDQHVDERPSCAPVSFRTPLEQLDGRATAGGLRGRAGHRYSAAVLLRRRRKARRRTALLMVLAAIIVIAVGRALGWWHALDLWWDGTLRREQSVLGLPVLWWGRIGKILQFIAGLTVVLDIVGPKRLAEAAKQRELRHRGALDAVDNEAALSVAERPLVELRSRVFSGLVYLEEHPGAVRMVVGGGRPPTIGFGINQEEFEAWLRKIRKQMGSMHSCKPHGDRACDTQVHFASAEAHCFAIAHLPKADLDRWEVAMEACKQSTPIGAWSLWKWMIGPAVASFAVFGLRIATLIACSVFLSSFVLVPAFGALPNRVELLIERGPAILFNRVLAAMLFHAQREHLRWAAVLLFVAGWSLDFFGS